MGRRDRLGSTGGTGPAGGGPIGPNAGSTRQSVPGPGPGGILSGGANPSKNPVRSRAPEVPEVSKVATVNYRTLILITIVGFVLFVFGWLKLSTREAVGEGIIAGGTAAVFVFILFIFYLILRWLSKISSQFTKSIGMRQGNAATDTESHVKSDSHHPETVVDPLIKSFPKLSPCWQNYSIISAATNLELEISVNDLLSDGFHLVGGPYTSTEDMQTIVSQAMFRPN